MYSIFEQLVQENQTSNYKVSKETGIAQATLSDWKNGKSVPKLEKLKVLADYFEVSVDYLTGNSSERKPINKDITEDDIQFAFFGNDENAKRKMNDLMRYVKMLNEEKTTED